MKKCKLKSSIISRIIASYLFVFILMTIFAGIFIYKYSSHVIGSEIDIQVINSLKGIAANIDGDEFERAVQAGNAKNEAYINIQKYLNKAYKSGNFEYLYTLMKKDDSYYYAVDSLFETDEDFSEYNLELEHLGGTNPFEKENKALNEGASVLKIEYYEDWGNIKTAYVSIANSKGEAVGLLACDILANHYMNSINKLNRSIILLLIVMIFIVFVILTVYLYKQFKPLKNIYKAIEDTSRGNYSNKLEIKNENEVGQISKLINNMNENLEFIKIDIDTSSKSINIASEKLNEKTLKFTENAKLLIEEAKSIKDLANEDFKNNKFITEETVIISKDIDKVIDNIQEVYEKANNSLEHAKKGGKIIQESQNSSEELNENIKSSKDKMEVLGENIKEIEKFLEVITEISNQTNLLSLNASIEAARAGESGKGFAVVASEVKKLSEESEKAVIDISEILKKVSISSKDMIEAMGLTVNTIEKNNKLSQKTESNFKEIVSGSKEIKIESENVLKRITEFAQKLKNIEENIDKEKDISMNLLDGCENISQITRKQFETFEQLSEMSEKLNEMSLVLEETMQKLN